MIAWIVTKLGISQLAVELILMGIIASGAFFAGIQVEAWHRDSQDLKELQETQKENDKLKTEAIKYNQTITDLRTQNDNLQDDAKNKTVKDPVCSDKPIPASRLQYLKKAYPGSANKLPKTLS